jgi:hypothetical protein
MSLDPHYYDFMAAGFSRLDERLTSIDDHLRTLNGTVAETRIRVAANEAANKAAIPPTGIWHRVVTMGYVIIALGTISAMAGVLKFFKVL